MRAIPSLPAMPWRPSTGWAAWRFATTSRARWRRWPPTAPPFGIEIHRRYNPEGITAYNIVPGLLGVILTMTMVLMTALAVTRETERGTMENLMAMPLRPAEVMLGKILPYVMVGYVQVVLVLLAARFLFAVPMLGSLSLLSVALLVFIVANLAVGFTFSTLARNQLQAMQMTFFFFLPSILLSGFMFPFRGMPAWAQAIGEVLPLTHFLRIVRGIMLKGTGVADIWPDVWPLLVFLAAASVLAPQSLPSDPGLIAGMARPRRAGPARPALGFSRSGRCPERIAPEP